MANNQISIADLEDKVVFTTIPKVLTNTFEVRLSPDNPSNVAVYTGELTSLVFERDFSYAQPRLRRVDRVNYLQDKKKIVSWFPFKRAIEKVPAVSEKLVWEVKVNHYGRALCKDEIIGFGEKGYSTYLLDLARREGVPVTSRLIDSVFGPLDEQLKKVYNFLYPNRAP